MKKFLLASLIFILLGFLSMVQAQEKEWEVAGDYAEACTCEKGCPCIFNSPPSHGSCDASLFFHIQKGHYGSTSLNGLTFAAVLRLGPQGNVAYYVDDKASAEQKKALEAIFKPMLRNIAPQELDTKYVPISVEIQPHTRALRIANILEFKIQRVRGMLPDAPTLITNPPMHFLSELVVAESLQYQYSDHGQSWNYSGRSGLYGSFHYSKLKK
jgi:hypothetical protein